MLLKSLREQVLEACLQMLADGFSNISEGNVSARDPKSGLIAISPTAIPYLALRPKDVCVIDAKGKQVKGKWRPTSEVALHLAIYSNRPDVNAIVHTHASFASVFAATGQAVPVALTESAMLLGGEVPVAPYRTPGSQELADGTLEVLGSGPAVLMAQHGLITVGDDLGGAYLVTLAVEQCARVACLARAMDAPLNLLPPEEIASLRSAYLENYHPGKA